MKRWVGPFAMLCLGATSAMGPTSMQPTCQGQFLFSDTTGGPAITVLSFAQAVLLGGDDGPVIA